MSAPGTYAPQAGAAPLHRMVLAHGLMEARLMARNGEQLLLALGIPLLLLVAGSQTHLVELGPGRRIDILVPGVLALAILSTSFTALAIATGFERRYGVLRWLGSSPLPRVGLLLGKGLAVLAVEAVQVAVVAGTGLLLGWHPRGGAVSALGAVVAVVLGTAAFSSLGLLMAGTLRAEATLAAANLVYLVLLVGGAVLVPAAQYPPGLRAAVGWLPSGALAEGLRALTRQGVVPWPALGVLALWAAVGAAVASRTFRWD